MNSLDRNIRNESKVNLIVTAANYTTTRAVGIAYKDLNGEWNLKFNIRGVLSSGAANTTLSIEGIQLKGLKYQPFTANSEGASIQYCRGGASGPDSNDLYLQFSAAKTIVQIQGDFELTSKPSWVE